MADEALDAYWRQYAAPVLRESGFRKRGRMYRFDDPHDGYAFVHALRQGGPFKIGVAVAVAPVTRLLAWWYERVDIIGDASWATYLNRARPGDDYVGDWLVVESQPERDRAGHELASYLREHAIPLAMRLLQYDELLDEIRHRHVMGMEPLGEYALELALLAERGPSTELDELLAAPPADPFEERAQTYARLRMADG